MGFVPLAKGSVSILSEPASEALKRNLVAYVPQSEDVDWTEEEPEKWANTNCYGH